jgi:hypothetical protein
MWPVIVLGGMFAKLELTGGCRGQITAIVVNWIVNPSHRQSVDSLNRVWQTTKCILLFKGCCSVKVRIFYEVKVRCVPRDEFLHLFLVERAWVD